MNRIITYLKTPKNPRPGPSRSAVDILRDKMATKTSTSIFCAGIYYIGTTLPLIAGLLVLFRFCCRNPPPRQNSPNLAQRLKPIFDNFLCSTPTPSRTLYTNYHININSYVNIKDLVCAILVSRPIWKESPPQTGPEGHSAHFWNCSMLTSAR